MEHRVLIYQVCGDHKPLTKNFADFERIRGPVTAAMMREASTILVSGFNEESGAWIYVVKSCLSKHHEVVIRDKTIHQVLFDCGLDLDEHHPLKGTTWTAKNAEEKEFTVILTRLLLDPIDGTTPH